MIFTCGICVGTGMPAGARSAGASVGGSVGGTVGSLGCEPVVFDGVANRFHIPSVVTIATVAIAVCTSFQLREVGLVAIEILSRRVLHRHHEIRCSWCYWRRSCFYLCVERVPVLALKHYLPRAQPGRLRSVHSALH